MEEVVVGVDVGTSKVCTLVGRTTEDNKVQIIGTGVEPSEGIKKGVIVDLARATRSITRSIELAEQTSGMEITSALVSLAGSKISSSNSRGVVAVPSGIISQTDVSRALQQAMAIAIPHDREIVHVIRRGFSVDGQEGTEDPVGMHGFSLEAETHVITAASAMAQNLRQCVNAAHVEVQGLVLNPLASGETVLTEQEREAGVAVVDVGGGTTDIAIYVNGDVWHSMVLPYGGNNITQDIAQVLRLPPAQAEEIKKKHGHAVRNEVGAEESMTIRPYGEDQSVRINRQDLAEIIEERITEIFSLVGQEISRSGYDGLLPAGIVLTGGTSLLPGIKKLGARVLQLPVRTAQPTDLVGLVDRLNTPAFSTSIGLLHWALTMRAHHIETGTPAIQKNRKGGQIDVMKGLKKWAGRLLP